MLINLRNALMTGKRLPYDAEVEYLESTGEQYIEVPMIVDNSATVDITGYVGRTNRELFSFDKRATTAFNIDTSATYYRWWTATSINIGSGYVGALHSYKCNSSIWVDGVLKGASTATEANTTQKFYIFNGHHSAASGRIYHASVEYGGRLILDAIPVRKGTVGYLYDRVTRKLFGNAGSGDFVLGPDVVPVEYIESHGTEWLKIPMAASSACDITCDFQRTTFSQSAPFGGGDGNLSNEILILPTSASAANTDWTYRSGDRQNLAAFSASQTARHTVRWLHNAAVLDGTEYSSITNSAVFTATRDYMGLFCSLRYGDASPVFVMTGRVYSAQFKDTTVTMPLSAVRVGTEGAMMDTLTRRIYRNAGTGAFTYGNDLKYPIPAE